MVFGALSTTGRLASVADGTRRESGTRVASTGRSVPDSASATSRAALPSLSHSEQATPTSYGTCTLGCHGRAHNAYGYDYPAAP